MKIDRWALSKLEGLVKRVEKSYVDYEFHVLYHAVHNFCSVDMSAFYLDILKDRLYTAPKTSVARRSAQTVMYRIIDALTRLIAPVLSFTADEIWQHIPGKESESVHLESFPRFKDATINPELEARYEKLMKVRTDVSKALEVARSEKRIGHSLDARVTLAASGDWQQLLNNYKDELATFFIVSQVEVVNELGDGVNGEQVEGLMIRVDKALGSKCERCWNYAETVGSHSDHPSICSRCHTALG